MSIKLVLEMEAGDQLTGENNEVEAANVATEVEAATSELAEVGDEAEEYAEGIETSVDAAGELQEVHDTLAASVEDGEGVSEETAKMAEIAVEAICAKVGISARETRMIPAMESFGSANSRLTATKLAMEGIKETAKRIWEAIKKAAIHVWNVIKNFFSGLTKSRTMLEKHLKNLKARAEAAEGAPKEKKISTGAKDFTVGGKASLETVSKVLDQSTKLMEASKKLTEALGQRAANVILKPEGADKAFEFFKGLELPVSAKSASKTSAHYGTFVGGRSLVMSTGAKGEKNPHLTIGFEVIEKEAAKEIQAPNKEEIKRVINAALDTLKALQEFDKVFKGLENINKVLIKVSEEMAANRLDMKKATEENEDTEGNDAAGQEANNARSLNKMISTIGTATPNIVFAAVKAAADYANAGINNLATTDKK